MRYVADKHPNALETLRVSKRQRALLSSYPPELPRSLLGLSTLPSSWDEHEIRAQINYDSDSEEEDELNEDDDDFPEIVAVAQPAPSKKVTGTLLYYLSGEPSCTRLSLPITNPDPRLALKTTKSKRPRDESPPIKIEKGTEAPKVCLLLSLLLLLNLN